MPIAYTLAPGRGDTDALLFGVSRRLKANGLRLAGTVQVNRDGTPGEPCDMDVQVLPDGPLIRISQSLGPQSRGCRLDPHALETAVFEVEKTLRNGTDLLIINKFGKHEADGHGFRSTIALAMSEGIPVLAGTNELNVCAFQDFADGFAEKLAPDFQTLVAWCERAVRPTRAVETVG